MPRPTNESPPARLALVPAVLAVMVLLAGLALVGGPWYVWIDYAVAILAAIIGVFAVQGKGRNLWWLLVVAPVVVLWNPVLPFTFGDDVLRVLTILASAALIAAGLYIRVRVAD